MGVWWDRPGLLDGAASRWFERIRVHANGRTTVIPLGRYRYRVVRGRDLREVVRRYTDPLPQFTFYRGHVDRIDQNGVVVDGNHMRAGWVYDSVIGPQLERAFGALFRFQAAEPALRFLDEATTPNVR